MIKNLVQAAVMMTIGYSGIFLLGARGIDFSPLVFTPLGIVVVFNLAFAYTFYFKL